MAQKFVSPGVFTSELDQSFLAQGVGAIGAAMVGRTLKGPAFVPTVVHDFDEFTMKFGTTDQKGVAQLPYAARNYLKNAGTLTVVRVLGDDDGTGLTNLAPTGTFYLLKDTVTGAALGTIFSDGALMVTGSIFTPLAIGTAGTTASLTLVSTASNGDVTFSSVATGSAANSLQVALISSTSSIAYVIGNLINVYYDDGVSTAANVVTAVALTASGLVTAVTGGTGLGIVTAHTATNLAGGTNHTYKYAAATASNNAGAADRWTKTLNYDPTKFAQKGYFVYQEFAWDLANTGALGLQQISSISASFAQNYTYAETPIITSQKFGANSYQLFRFWTKGAGAAANTDVKVSIQNVKPSVNDLVTPYGTFDVVIRAYGDQDGRQAQLETFTNLTLDPNSVNYVARVIGDQYVTWDNFNRKLIPHGDYKGYSNYIRIDMSIFDADAPKEALPWGHLGLPVPGNGATTASLPLVPNQKDSSGNINNNVYFGVNFGDASTPIDDVLQYLPPDVRTAMGVTDDNAFSLSYLTFGLYNGRITASYDALSAGTYQPLVVSSSLQKFTVPFYGGFDGFDLTDSDPLSVSDGQPEGVAGSAPIVWLKRGVDAVSNPDLFDMNVLSLPGITNFKAVDYGRKVCNDRADCFFVMDIPGSAVNDAIAQLNNRGIDDNYSACYYPDIKYNDTIWNRIVLVKPSVLVLAAIAYNDRVGQPFFAPAGLNRGGLGQFGAVDVQDRLTFQDRNDLYEARINPIATFPNEGIVVFGQKTLQVKPSALDRVNVRRLLIYAKKLVASTAKYLLFEPDNPNTWLKFVNTVNPILDKIRQDQGVDRFKVVMDSTTNTPDLIDRNIMTGKIFLQPTKSAEFIDLQFIITSSGVQFAE
jgi:hypothetical protein